MANFNYFLQKIESYETSLISKTVFKRDLRKGDLVSVIYYEIEKEQIKLQQFAGKCYCRTHGGLNTIIGVSSLINKVNIKQKFFLYSRLVLDISVLKRR
jgi:ribosomal protein L19